MWCMLSTYSYPVSSNVQQLRIFLHFQIIFFLVLSHLFCHTFDLKWKLVQATDKVLQNHFWPDQNSQQASLSQTLLVLKSIFRMAGATKQKIPRWI